jgi:hypothetical protein
MKKNFIFVFSFVGNALIAKNFKSVLTNKNEFAAII